MNRQKLIDSLIEHEGIRNLPYSDSEGFLTIGVGHKLDAIPLSPAVIQMILEDDIAHVERELHHVIPYWHEGLNHERQNIIVEMAFQMGATGVKNFKKMWEAIKEEDFTKAAKEMLDSRWHKQTPNRAKSLAERMERG